MRKIKIDAKQINKFNFLPLQMSNSFPPTCMIKIIGPYRLSHIVPNDFPFFSFFLAPDADGHLLKPTLNLK